jgi:glycosyltransferase involved in cell wall biosynthesis
MASKSILQDQYSLSIVWISQMLWTSRPGAMLGNTDRVEMPRYIAKLGHRVHMVYGAPLGDILRGTRLIPYLDATYLPMMNLPFLSTLSFHLTLIFALPWLLLRYTPNVIIVDHFSVLSIVPWAFVRKLGLLRCSVVLDLRTLPVDAMGWHGWITNRRFDLSVIFANRFFDGITMITPKLRDILCRRLRISPARVGIWESGVNLRKLQEGKNRKGEFGWEDKFIVMYHGTLSPNRGLQAAVKAFAELKIAYPDARLFFLGEGAAWKELQTLIKQLHLEELVSLHPAVSYEEVADYVASADVGIIPLPDIEWWNTSSPLKLMEYLALGKPVILSRIAAHIAVLPESEGAYYLETVTAEAIAKGVRHFYARKNELERLGAMGRKIAGERFSWSVQAKRLLSYLNVIRTKRKVN